MRYYLILLGCDRLIYLLEIMDKLDRNVLHFRRLSGFSYKSARKIILLLSFCDVCSDINIFFVA